MYLIEQVQNYNSKTKTAWSTKNKLNFTFQDSAKLYSSQKSSKMRPNGSMHYVNWADSCCYCCYKSDTALILVLHLADAEQPLQKGDTACSGYLKLWSFSYPQPVFFVIGKILQRSQRSLSKPHVSLELAKSCLGSKN